MTEFPVVGGSAVVIIGVIVGLFRWLVQNDLVILRQQNADLAKRITQLETLYDEQRTEKHRLNNELGKAQMLLAIIIDLAESCTCGALKIVEDLMERARNLNLSGQPSEDG